MVGNCSGSAYNSVHYAVFENRGVCAVEVFAYVPVCNRIFVVESPDNGFVCTFTLEKSFFFIGIGIAVYGNLETEGVFTVCTCGGSNGSIAYSDIGIGTSVVLCRRFDNFFKLCSKIFACKNSFAYIGILCREFCRIIGNYFICQFFGSRECDKFIIGIKTCGIGSRLNHHVTDFGAPFIFAVHVAACTFKNGRITIKIGRHVSYNVMPLLVTGVNAV